MNKTTTLLFIVMAFITSFLNAQITVGTVSEIQSAFDSASAGDIITIENGTYSDGDFDIEVNGTSTNPVIIQAETSGSVIFDNCRIKMGGSYITLTGIEFSGTYGWGTTGASSYAISFKNSTECSNCTFTQSKIDSYNPSSTSTDFRWIRVYGQDNEISYCTFNGKNNIGSIIFNQRGDGIEDRMLIHHNYFSNRLQVGTADSANDLDVMRIGDSNQSLTSSASQVYNNYFYNANGGEPEVISNKSGGNKYYNNTFDQYLGSLSLRHGNGCEVYNNFFINPGQDESYFNGGIRVEGEDHLVYNNYIQGTNATKQGESSKAGSLGAINVSAGQSESNFVLNGYGIVKNAVIVHNTIVDCDLGLRIGPDSGGSNQEEPPEDIIVANNLFVDCGEYIEVDRAAIGATVYSNNMFEGSGSATTGFTSESNLLSTTTNTYGIYPITSSSPAVDAANSSYGPTYFSDDVYGGSRDSSYDVGAHEYGSGITLAPYTQSDVGITVGFGASEGAVFNVSPSSFSFSGVSDSDTFTITTEDDTTWTITEGLSWVSLSSTSGTGTTEITLTVTDNTAGSDRSGSFTISPSNGEDDLTVTVEQNTDAYTVSGLTITSATAIGTESGKTNVSPDFAWDGLIDTANYWAGNPENALISPDGAEITFDLGCIRQLDLVGIYFKNSLVRSTQFSLEVSENNSTFTTVLDSVSSTSGVADETEQQFDISGNQAQYIKIIAEGNSAGSGWVSIIETVFYGNADSCEEESVCSSTPYNAFSTIEGEDYCEMSGITTNSNTEVDGFATSINVGDWIRYSIDFGSTSPTKMRINSGSNYSNGIIEIRSGSISSDVVASVAIDTANGWYNFDDFYGDVTSNLTGEHDIYFTFTGNSDTYLFTIDNFEFGDDTLSNEDFSTSLNDNGVTLFPIPVTGEELNINSANQAINGIQIFNIVGQEVLATDAGNSNRATLNVGNLNAGVYFILLEGIGTGKFVIN